MSAKILLLAITALMSSGLAPALAQQPSYQPISDQPLPAANSSQSAPLRDALPTTTPSTVAPALVVTTTDKVDGYHVRRYLGIARGVKVFQPTIGQNFKAGLRSIVGGAVSSYADMCEHARAEAFEQLERRATELGANAIVGLRFDTAAFSVSGADIGTEVICYGTAVSLEADR